MTGIARSPRKILKNYFCSVPQKNDKVWNNGEYTCVQKFNDFFFKCFLKKSFKGTIYLLKHTVRTLILWNGITI